jgi:hypothetical protein
MSDLADFINERAKENSPIPMRSLQLCRLRREALTGSKTVNDSLNQLLAVWLVGIRSIEDQIKSIDKAIASSIEAFQNVLVSISGIGPIYSAGLMVGIGDIQRFDK